MRDRRVTRVQVQQAVRGIERQRQKLDPGQGGSHLRRQTSKSVGQRVSATCAGLGCQAGRNVGKQADSHQPPCGVAAHLRVAQRRLQHRVQAALGAILHQQAWWVPGGPQIPAHCGRRRRAGRGGGGGRGQGRGAAGRSLTRRPAARDPPPSLTIRVPQSAHQGGLPLQLVHPHTRLPRSEHFEADDGAVVARGPHLAVAALAHAFYQLHVARRHCTGEGTHTWQEVGWTGAGQVPWAGGRWLHTPRRACGRAQALHTRCGGPAVSAHHS